MNLSHPLRRTALFGLMLGVAACDVAQFIQDPKPRLVQTWNLPASSSTISVAKLLPAGVSIYSTPASNPPDSIGFSVTISSTTISRVVGSDCATCVTLNGTNAPKPSFTLNATNSTPLPTNVVSAAITGGKVLLAITNNLSFDPLYINTGEARGARGATGFGRDNEPNMTLTYAFKTQLFWVVSRTNNCLY